MQIHADILHQYHNVLLFRMQRSTYANLSACYVGLPKLCASDTDSSSLFHIAVDHNFVMQVRPKRRAPITQVLMVGGATRMPAFKRFVRNMTGLEAKGTAIDPDEVRPSSCTGECLKPFTLHAIAHKACSSMVWLRQHH